MRRSEKVIAPWDRPVQLLGIRLVRISPVMMLARLGLQELMVRNAGQTAFLPRHPVNIRCRQPLFPYKLQSSPPYHRQ